MAYGTLASDTLQSSTTGVPTQFQDGSGTQIGTLCRAWVNFPGSTGTRNASFNVSSVTVNSTGNFTVTFTNAFSDTNYSVVTASSASGASVAGTFCAARATTTCTIYTVGAAYYTQDYVSIAIFR